MVPPELMEQMVTQDLPAELDRLDLPEMMVQRVAVETKGIKETRDWSDTRGIPVLTALWGHQVM